MRHSRLKMTRLEYWQLHAGGPVVLPHDRAWLRSALMQPTTRQVRSNAVRLHSYTYWHERLQGYDGVPLEVRWDPADLEQVMVLTGGDPIIASRMRPRSVDSPADLAEHREQKRRVREERRVLREAAETLANGSTANQQTFAKALEEARAHAPIPFPAQARKADVKRPELLTGEELIEQMTEVDPAEVNRTERPPGQPPTIMYGENLDEGRPATAEEREQERLRQEAMRRAPGYDPTSGTIKADRAEAAQERAQQIQASEGEREGLSAETAAHDQAEAVALQAEGNP